MDQCFGGGCVWKKAARRDIRLSTLRIYSEFNSAADLHTVSSPFDAAESWNTTLSDAGLPDQVLSVKLTPPLECRQPPGDTRELLTLLLLLFFLPPIPSPAPLTNEPR